MPRLLKLTLLTNITLTGLLRTRLELFKIRDHADHVGPSLLLRVSPVGLPLITTLLSITLNKNSLTVLPLKETWDATEESSSGDMNTFLRTELKTLPAIHTRDTNRSATRTQLPPNITPLLPTLRLLKETVINSLLPSTNNQSLLPSMLPESSSNFTAMESMILARLTLTTLSF